MACSATPDGVTVECPDFGTCRKAGCPRFLVRVSREGVDDSGRQLYGGACMLNGDVEWFHGCLPLAGPAPEMPDSHEEGMDGFIRTLKKEVVQPVQRSIRAVKTEVHQVHRNAVQILDNQGDEERLTNHDNEAYHPRYESIKLDMLEEACGLVDSGKMNRSQAAVCVFRRHSKERHGFSSELVFKSTFYRYYKNKSRRT